MLEEADPRHQDSDENESFMDTEDYSINKTLLLQSHQNAKVCSNKWAQRRDFRVTQTCTLGFMDIITMYGGAKEGLKCFTEQMA